MILIIKTEKHRRDIIVTELTVIKNSSKLRRLSETNEVNSFKSWYHHNKPTKFRGYRTSAGFEYSFMLKSKWSSYFEDILQATMAAVLGVIW